ncbi:adenine deaminase C-terminal domain-containing protein [Megasphaera sp.]|uniref:adenine deaminase C-terminal domain-containing protein n=1 Tax=Megasphaera sp. TaxID=2023260 RepID=UPI0025BB849D|nr:adenine deaminase C-terminal domain-containing protein [Megasphaera sp.]
MDELYAKAHDILGVSADVDVIMTLCFMSLPVSPKLKLLDTGLFDVEAFDFVPVELD